MLIIDGRNYKCGGDSNLKPFEAVLLQLDNERRT